MTDDKSKHALDLPLMSSTDSRHIHHYILDLTCDLDEKVFTGSIILFSKSVMKNDKVPEPEIPEDESKDVQIRSNSCFVKYDNNGLLYHSYSDHKYHHIRSDKNNVHVQQGHVDGIEGKRVSHDLSNENNADPKVANLNTNAFENAYAATENRSVLNASQVGFEKGHFDLVTKHGDCPTEKFCEEHKALDELKEKQSECRKGDDLGVYDFFSDSYNTHNDKSGISRKAGYVQSEIDTSLTQDYQERSACYSLVLDCWDIDVEKVEEVLTSQLDGNESLKDLDKSELSEIINESDKELLQFNCDKKSIQVWKEGAVYSNDFPDMIRIFYTTRPDGHSLKWTKDQDGNICVYTHGHWINNRSLFPSQDIPHAMATWRAYIHVPRHMTVLMTGDHNGETWEKSPGYLTHYFYSKMDMPSSTLALAVGQWTQVANEGWLDNDTKSEEIKPKETIPLRVFAPKCFAKIAEGNLYPYIGKSLTAATHLLGQYPFYRLDIVIVPSSFNSLGMASPSLMFLSQSVLSKDGGMLVRVSHEISHSWFGLLIGPKDWTEEWLSEGFCTYTEGIIHSYALQLTATEFEEIRELQDYMKYRNLQTELSVIDADLQTLRPSQHDTDTDQDGISYVKNGMNPDKGFMQLHYLKGYFLLCFLESVVGLDNFCLFLKKIVQQFHHQLINSLDVLTFFTKTFQEECLFNCMQRKSRETRCFKLFQKIYCVMCNDVPMVKKCLLQITKLNTSYSALHWRKRRKLDIPSSIDLKKMNIVQTLLLLDGLLCEGKLQGDILIGLNACLNLSSANPDIQHKWCELVVKFCVPKRYRDVEQFLVDHQAMGVYLVGELILSKDREQRKIAESAFNLIKHDLEDGVYKTICLMIYGTECVR